MNTGKLVILEVTWEGNQIIYIYIHSRKSDLYEIYSHEKLQTVLLLNLQFILNVASAGFLRISYSYCFREQHPGGNYCLG